MCVRPQ
jgi:hypothetical protein